MNPAGRGEAESFPPRNTAPRSRETGETMNTDKDLTEAYGLVVEAGKNLDLARTALDCVSGRIKQLRAEIKPEFVPMTREEAEERRLAFNYGHKAHLAESYIRLLDDHQKLVDAVTAWQALLGRFSVSDSHRRAEKTQAMLRAAGIKD